jgi:hypothetical protein
MKQKPIVFQDQIGRTIIANKVSETDATLTVENPVMFIVNPDQSGQFQVQSFPIFFFEFINKDARDSNVWTYNKTAIVTSDVDLDDRVVEQYGKINTPPAPVASSSPKVISISDL